MTTPSQPPTAQPRFSQPPLQEQSRRLFTYLRGPDGWLLLGFALGGFSGILALLAWSQQQRADIEAPVRWDSPVLLLYKGMIVLWVLCGALFLLLLLRFLQPWWTRVFPALTVLCFALFVLYFPVFTAVDTPLSRALYDALDPLLIAASICGALGLLSLAVAWTLHPL